MKIFLENRPGKDNAKDTKHQLDLIHEYDEGINSTVLDNLFIEVF